MVGAVTSQQEGSWFESKLGRFCVEFACCTRVCVGLLLELWFKAGGRLIVDTKLSVGEFEWFFISICQPCGNLSRVYPAYDAGMGSNSPPVDLLLKRTPINWCGSSEKGGTVAQWLALSPHSKKVLGSNPN